MRTLRVWFIPQITKSFHVWISKYSKPRKTRGTFKTRKIFVLQFFSPKNIRLYGIAGVNSHKQIFFVLIRIHWIDQYFRRRWRSISVLQFTYSHTHTPTSSQWDGVLMISQWRTSYEMVCRFLCLKRHTCLEFAWGGLQTVGHSIVFDGVWITHGSERRKAILIRDFFHKNSLLSSKAPVPPSVLLKWQLSTSNKSDLPCWVQLNNAQPHQPVRVPGQIRSPSYYNPFAPAEQNVTLTSNNTLSLGIF